MPQEERTCPSCGILYSAPSKWWDEQRKTGGVFYCPNGHARHFIKGKSEADKLREELSRERQRLAEYNDALRSEREKREAAERREAAQKANVTKLKSGLALAFALAATGRSNNLPITWRISTWNLLKIPGQRSSR